MKSKAQSAKVKLGSISKHLPPALEEGILVQGRIRDEELVSRLREKLKKDKVTIAEWMEASMKAYLEE
jgi:hypothetical protein